MKKLLLTVAMAGIFALVSFADYLVVPAGYENNAGNTAFNSILRDLPRTIQFVYAPEDLASLPNGAQINGITFRLYPLISTWPFAPVSWANYDITLSTCLTPPTALSGDFADNIGPDATLVRSGPLQIDAFAFPSGSPVSPWGQEFSFTTPYVYTSGNSLLITISHDGNASSSQFIDYINSIDYGTGMVFVSEYNGTSGSATTGTYISRLTYDTEKQVPLSNWSLPIVLLLILSIVIFRKYRFSYY